MLNNRNFDASRTNWVGLWTLFSKETSRFLKVFYQTVLAPVVTNILFLTVFLIVIDREDFIIGGVSYSSRFSNDANSTKCIHEYYINNYDF